MLTLLENKQLLSVGKDCLSEGEKDGGKYIGSGSFGSVGVICLKDEVQSTNCKHIMKAIDLSHVSIEDAINEHPAVAESAIVGFPHDIKGNALYGYVVLKDVGESRDRSNLSKEINQLISDQIGPIAKLDKIQFVNGLPKTRSGKIMRRILRKVAEGDASNLGDITTLLDEEVVVKIIDGALVEVKR